MDVLRLSIFQLLHLDRVPASAIVDDAVDLTKRAGKKSAAPLVNAVLRRVSRERDNLPLPPRPADRSDREAVLDYLAITLSHPRWLAARWLDRYGFDAAEKWLRFNNSPAALNVARAAGRNRSHVAGKPVNTGPVPLVEDDDDTTIVGGKPLPED